MNVAIIGIICKAINGHRKQKDDEKKQEGIKSSFFISAEIDFVFRPKIFAELELTEQLSLVLKLL